eukprot:scpid93326/ scgid12460/ 
MAAESLASKPSQPSGQDRRPGFQWTRRLTLELISARSENDGLFQDINWRKKSVWNRISQRIAATFPDEELHPSAEQCENRWKNLMKAYKAYVDSQQKTGADRKQPPAFYDEMNATFGWKPNIHPKCVGGPLVPVTRPPKCPVELSDSEDDQDGEARVSSAPTTPQATPVRLNATAGASAAVATPAANDEEKGVKKRRKRSGGQSSDALEWLKQTKCEDRTWRERKHNDQMAILGDLTAAVNRLAKQ